MYAYGMEIIDWTAAKTAYVTGSESYRELAIRFGVSESQMSKKGTRGKWPDLRKEYRAKCAKRALEKASRAQANKLAKIYEASDILDQVVMELLMALKNDGLDTIMGNGTPGRELESLSKTLLNNDELKRRLNGILMPRDAERLKIDREKLDLERKKFEDGTQTDNKIQIVFGEGVKELAE